MESSTLEHYYAVIMAGGGGTRLWPLSRQQRPKQMLSLFDERSLFQTSVQRLQGLFAPEHILVVTVESQAAELHRQAPQIPFENFLLEPQARGTASVVGLAAVAVQQRDPQGVMAVLTADHFIRQEDAFRDLLRTAYAVALEDHLVTLGIHPTFPAQGFGYIQRGALLAEWDGQPVYRVLRFKEKPNEEQARQMLVAGDHTWNSGMFIWRSARILAELERQMPHLAAALGQVSAAWSTPEREATIRRLWPSLANETIDYGVMEKAADVAVIPAEGLGWSDVGSWESLFDLLPGDENGNIVIGGQHVGLETKNSLVYATDDRRLIVTIGVEDLVIVDAGDVLLVCPRDQAQQVRQVVSRLKQEDRGYT